MYSYEDRIRAVRLYIKLGKRLAATIRRAGTRQRTRLSPGIANTNNVMMCGAAMYVRGRSIHSNRRRQLSITI
jgi:hypothetical protein